MIIKALVYGFLILLSACASTPNTNTETTSTQYSKAESLLSQANIALEPHKTELKIAAANEYFLAKDFNSCSTTLQNTTNTNHLDHIHQAKFIFLQSQCISYTNAAQAPFWFEQMTSDALSTLNEENQWLWQRSYAELLAKKGKLSNAISLLDHLEPILSETQRQELNFTLWEITSTQPSEQLAINIKNTQSELIKGWLELALIIKNDTELQFKGIALSQWLSSNPNHPASLNLPLEARSLPLPDQAQIKSIAVLLPLEGKFANVSKAITQGLIMASFQLPPDIRPDIQIINSNSGNFISTYNDIHADLILGPLDSKNVQALQALPQLKYPTIALNSPNTKELPSNLFFMGLQAEDEAKTMAKEAIKRNLKTGAVLTYDSNKGMKLASEFSQAFNQQGGKISHIQVLDKSWANSLKSLLEIDKSNQRAQQISRLVRSPIEFTARRRNDIEFIYSPLKYKDLRQTNPLMAFYFADSIQVFSNSDISSRLYSNKKDKDLNNIIFADSNWSPNKYTSSDLLPGKEEPSAKLYSWGADIFSAAINLPTLLAINYHQVKAFSSNIYFNGQNQLIREFPVSYVRYGKPYEASPTPIKVH